MNFHSWLKAKQRAAIFQQAQQAQQQAQMGPAVPMAPALFASEHSAPGQTLVNTPLYQVPPPAPPPPPMLGPPMPGVINFQPASGFGGMPFPLPPFDPYAGQPPPGVMPVDTSAIGVQQQHDPGLTWHSALQGLKNLALATPGAAQNLNQLMQNPTPLLQQIPRGHPGPLDLTDTTSTTNPESPQAALNPWQMLGQVGAHALGYLPPPPDSVTGAATSAVNTAMQGADWPRRRNTALIGRSIYDQSQGNDLSLYTIANPTVGVEEATSQATKNVSELVNSVRGSGETEQALFEYANDPKNKTEIQNAYKNGYEIKDAKGKVIKHFDGYQAVWEQYQAHKSALSRAVSAAATDPTTYLPIASGFGRSLEGSAIARELALTKAGVLPEDLPKAITATKIAGRTLQAPEAAFDLPFKAGGRLGEAVFGGAGRLRGLPVVRQAGDIVGHELGPTKAVAEDQYVRARREAAAQADYHRQVALQSGAITPEQAAGMAPPTATAPNPPAAPQAGAVVNGQFVPFGPAPAEVGAAPVPAGVGAAVPSQPPAATTAQAATVYGHDPYTRPDGQPADWWWPRKTGNGYTREFVSDQEIRLYNPDGTPLGTVTGNNASIRSDLVMDELGKGRVPRDLLEPPSTTAAPTNPPAAPPSAPATNADAINRGEDILGGPSSAMTPTVAPAPAAVTTPPPTSAQRTAQRTLDDFVTKGPLASVTRAYPAGVAESIRQQLAPDLAAFAQKYVPGEVNLDRLLDETRLMTQINASLEQQGLDPLPLDLRYQGNKNSIEARIERYIADARAKPTVLRDLRSVLTDEQAKPETIQSIVDGTRDTYVTIGRVKYSPEELRKLTPVQRQNLANLYASNKAEANARFTEVQALRDQFHNPAPVEQALPPTAAPPVANALVPQQGMGQYTDLTTVPQQLPDGRKVIYVGRSAEDTPVRIAQRQDGSIAVEYAQAIPGGGHTWTESATPAFRSIVGKDPHDFIAVARSVLGDVERTRLNPGRFDTVLPPIRPASDISGEFDVLNRYAGQEARLYRDPDAGGTVIEFKDGGAFGPTTTQQAQELTRQYDLKPVETFSDIVEASPAAAAPPDQPIQSPLLRRVGEPAPPAPAAAPSPIPEGAAPSQGPAPAAADLIQQYRPPKGTIGIVGTTPQQQQGAQFGADLLVGKRQVSAEVPSLGDTSVLGQIHDEGGITTEQYNLLNETVNIDGRDLNLYDAYQHLLEQNGHDEKAARLQFDAMLHTEFKNKHPELFPARGRTKYTMTNILKAYDAASNQARNNIMYNVVTGPRGILGDLAGDDFAIAIAHGLGAATKLWEPQNWLRALSHVRGQADEALINIPEFQFFHDLGLSGPGHEVTAVHGRGETPVGGEMPIRQTLDKRGLDNRLAHTAEGVVQNKLIRDGRVAMDQFRRLVVKADTMQKELPQAQLRFARYLQEHEQRIGMSSQEMWAKIEERASARITGQKRAYKGIFAPEDVFAALNDTDASRVWRSEVNGLNKLGQREVDRILFSYKQTNLDKQMSRLFLFNYWQSRAILLHTKTALKNPWLLATYGRTWNYLNTKAKQEGYPPSLRGWIDFMGGKGGFWSFINPVGFLVPYTMFNEFGNQNNQDRGWEKFVKKYGLFINPMFQASAAAFGWAHSPGDPTGLWSIRNMIRAVADWDRNNGNVLGLHVPNVTGQGPGLTEDYMQKITDKVFATSSHFFHNLGVPGAEKILNTDPTQTEVGQVNNLIITAQEQKYGPQSGWDKYNTTGKDGVIENKVWNETLEAQQAAISDHPEDNPLAKEALSQYSSQEIKTRTIADVAPGGVRVRYGPQDTRRAAVSDFFNAKGTGGVPAAGADNTNLGQQLATAGSPEAAKLILQQNQYGQLGTPEQQSLAGFWNEIAFNNLSTHGIRIGGKLYTTNDLTQMTGDDRKALADQFLAQYTQAGATDKVQALRDTQSAFKDKNPEYSSYADWRGNAYSDPGGVGAFRKKMSRVSPSYRNYINSLPADLTPEQLDTKSISLDAYLASEGEKATIYDQPVGDTFDPTKQQAADVLYPQSSSGSSSGGKGGGNSDWTASMLTKDLTTYQTKLDAYNAAVKQLSGGYTMDQLMPGFQDVLQQKLDALNISKPYAPQIVQAYQLWLASLPPNSDTSPQAFISWFKQRQADVQAQYAGQAGQYPDAGTTAPLDTSGYTLPLNSSSVTARSGMFPTP